ncbi:hypothetical protein SELMODRAFT_413524 [Selaginella moellendorffii]|uniref:F-box associated beta-propeller type 3 domain-containing protein n=1 Tax=Selaginella moellendorffii TaxID=88036 RepID=D8RQJ6_SELML|nr:hypothetical protein SELMODRAFT_413524 [Selaginella moellendorffii]
MRGTAGAEALGPVADRLPVWDLFQCVAVSKSWRDAIVPKMKRERWFLVVGEGRAVWACFPRLGSWHRFKLPANFLTRRYVVDYSQGLVCMGTSSKLDLVVWNPATGWNRSIPRSPSKPCRASIISMLVDESTNELLKIVIISPRITKPLGDYERIKDRGGYLVEIFDATSNEWSTSTSTGVDTMLKSRGSWRRRPVLAKPIPQLKAQKNGVIYFVEKIGNNDARLMSLDVEANAWKEVPLPKRKESDYRGEREIEMDYSFYDFRALACVGKRIMLLVGDGLYQLEEMSGKWELVLDDAYDVTACAGCGNLLLAKGNHRTLRSGSRKVEREEEEEEEELSGDDGLFRYDVEDKRAFGINLDEDLAKSFGYDGWDHTECLFWGHFAALQGLHV